MADLQQFDRTDAIARRYQYGDRTVLVVDVGAGVEGSVDVVDGTAIVVVGDDQYELALPEGTASAFMKNGVVTIEVEG
jgi:hypothetical protein